MLWLDAETTGLVDNEGLPLSQQPHIIEIGVLKTDEAGNELDSFSSLIRPSNFTTLPEIITKITGIQDTDLKDAPLFLEMYGALATFFRGERELLAHKVGFDLMVLVFELRRIGKEFKFPYCSDVTDTMTIFHHRLSSWAAKVKGPDFVQTHRALDDARLLRDCYFSGVTE
jgi:DNA polymerase III epsilon subunit-like protein